MRKDILELKCLHCGGNLVMTDKTHAKCEYCDNTYLIDEVGGKVVEITIIDNTSDRVKRSVKKLPVILACFIAVMVLVVMIAYCNNKMIFNKNYFRQGQAPAEDADKTIGVLFCEDVFEKKYNKISKEQLSSIKYLSIDSRYYNNKGTIYTIWYSFKDYDSCATTEEFTDSLQKWTYNAEYINDLVKSVDFKMLTGLTAVDFTKCNIISNIKLSKECRIKYVNVSCEMQELEKLINPDYVKILRISIKRSDKDNLVGIEKYGQLEELSYIVSLAQASNTQMDISQLLQCKNLKGLHLQCGNTYSGIQVLGTLKSLKSIYIDNITFDECTFLKDLNDIEELSVKAGKGATLMGLEKMTSLEKLCFLDREVINANKLSSLKQLKELKVTLAGNDSIGILVQLEELLNLDAEFRNTSINDVLDISQLAQLKKLKSINIRVQDTFNYKVYGVEALLNKSGIESVILTPGVLRGLILMIKTNELKGNSSLRILEIPNCYVADRDTGAMSDYTFLEKYPNIRTLNLSNSGVSSLRFISTLKSLETVKLTENKIDSYKPLLECKRLKRLYITRDKLSNKNKEELSDLPSNTEVIDEDDF